MAQRGFGMPFDAIWALRDVGHCSSYLGSDASDLGHQGEPGIVRPLAGRFRLSFSLVDILGDGSRAQHPPVCWEAQLKW